MRIKFIKPEDFVNYRKCSMFIGTCFCDWKCCKELNIPLSICQNNAWSSNPIIDMANETIISSYVANDITEAIVIGGLEPMLQFDELYEFIDSLRKVTDDDVVIYTGYYPHEITDKTEKLSKLKNIIIKFGRYIPNRPSRYDDILGVRLASDNQYAEKIS